MFLNRYIFGVALIANLWFNVTSLDLKCVADVFGDLEVSVNDFILELKVTTPPNVVNVAEVCSVRGIAAKVCSKEENVKLAVPNLDQVLVTSDNPVTVNLNLYCVAKVKGVPEAKPFNVEDQVRVDKVLQVVSDVKDNARKVQDNADTVKAGVERTQRKIERAQANVDNAQRVLGTPRTLAYARDVKAQLRVYRTENSLAKAQMRIYKAQDKVYHALKRANKAQHHAKKAHKRAEKAEQRIHKFQ